MAILRLINLSRRAGNPSHFFTARQSLSTAVSAASAAADGVALPSPPPPTAMIYDRLAESVKEKLKKLQDPDPRFLKYNSPHPTVDSHAEILTTPLTRVTTLPNGLRIATESTLESKTATVGVYIDAGSRFETEEGAGSAHYVEQMIFRGTKKRTMVALMQEIENVGGLLDGYNSREQSAVYAKVMDKDVPCALDILSDILQNSKFDEMAIYREKEGILRHIEEMQGETKEVIYDHLHATAFQHTPLGRTTHGTIDNIKRLRRKDLLNYVSTNHTASRMVVAASGAVKHEDIVEQVKKLFVNLPTHSTTTSDLVAREPAIFTGSEVRMLDDDKPLTHFAVAFEGSSWTDPDSVALWVMQAMLGTWSKDATAGKHMGSGLVQRIAINEIAESITSFSTNYKDTGLFGVYVVAKPDCLDDLAYAIMHEMTKLCYRVSETDVIRARNQVKASLLLQLNGTKPVTQDIGRQLLKYGRRIPFPEFFARIDSVDASTVKRVANRFIFDRDLAIAAAGPIQGLPDYNWFRRRTYWLRY